VWLITGVAGFIGSNLLEALLHLDQKVIGLDNFATGCRCNLKLVRESVGPRAWEQFRLIEGDVQDTAVCRRATRGAHYILHQAGIGSVPRSIADPKCSHDNNVTGFLNLLMAARDNGAERLVFASSSSVYGDHPALPKVETKIGNCLSPYAATKRFSEIYAEIFACCYGMQTIGLRYFNVFGPRQDPDGAYAAVIPRWIAALINRQPVLINGDGKTSRDFCYVANVIQANILAATVRHRVALNQVYNVALASRTSLNELFDLLRVKLLPYYPHLLDSRPVYQDFRPGDVRHSEGDISKAKRLLGYRPTHTLEQGLTDALGWYRGHLNGSPSRM
jgi:UDP-N-acetylglucosamine 4-epimerase